MLGFPIAVISPYEARKGKEDGKRHTMSTYFSNFLQKMVASERRAGLCMGRWGMVQRWICGILTIIPILWASVPPSRAMKVGIR